MSAKVLGVSPSLRMELSMRKLGDIPSALECSSPPPLPASHNILKQPLQEHMTVSI